MPLDEDDRSMATGAPFLLVAQDGSQPPVTSLSSSVAVAMALRDVGGGAPAAYLHERPPRPADRPKTPP